MELITPAKDEAKDEAKEEAKDEAENKETVEVTDEMNFGISQIDSKKNPIPNQGSANFLTSNAITVPKLVISEKIAR